MKASDPAAVARGEEAVRVAPFSGGAHGVLAAALHTADRHEEALAAVERAYAAEEPPAAGELDALQGFALRALRRNEDAAVYLGRAYAALESPGPVLAFEYGCSLRDAHRAAEAIEPLERAARGGLGWQAEFNLGGALRDVGRHEDAIAAYRRSRSSPSYQGYFAHLREAEALIDQRRPAEGLKLLEEALASRSGPAALKSPDMLSALAMAHVRTGSFEEGLEFAVRVIDGGGTRYDRAYISRVEALEGLGRRVEASAAAADGLARFPGSPFFTEHARPPEQR